MDSGIYTITNKTNGKVYVGSTVDFEKRWGEHRNSLRRGDHHNPYLQRSWTKYGKSIFVFGVLEYVDSLDELVKVEQFWMDAYREEGKKLYNVGLAADCPMRGRHHTEEQRLNLSIAHVGKTHSEETKRRIAEGNKGKVVSEETRRKQSKAAMGNKHCLGKHLTDEHKYKISVSSKGRIFSDAHRRRLSESGKRSWARRRASTQ